MVTTIYQLSENSKRVDNIRIPRYIDVGKLRAQNTNITVSAFGVDIDSTNVEVEDAILDNDLARNLCANRIQMSRHCFYSIIFWLDQ